MIGLNRQFNFQFFFDMNIMKLNIWAPENHNNLSSFERQRIETFLLILKKFKTITACA